MSDDLVRQEMRMIREMGANFIRLAHYQHDQLFYSLCDEGGIGVWAELCFVNAPPKTPEGLANAKEQLRELIRQNYNHPAILFWSIGNETSGQDDAADKLLAELAATDAHWQSRQVSVVDAEGRAAAFTGENAPTHAGHHLGEGYAIAGNVLTFSGGNLDAAITLRQE